LTETVSKRDYLKQAFTALFSLYLSVVVFSIEEPRSFSLSTRLRLLDDSVRHPGMPRRIDAPHQERLITFFLCWVAVGIFFLLLRAIERFPRAKRILLTLAGLLALGGLPMALLLTGYGNRTILVVLIALSGLATIINIYFQLPRSDGVALGLLVLYFGLSTFVAWRSWTTFPLGFYALWPGWDWVLGTWEVAKNVYPILGFAFAVVWGMYNRREFAHTATA